MVFHRLFWQAQTQMLFLVTCPLASSVSLVVISLGQKHVMEAKHVYRVVQERSFCVITWKLFMNLYQVLLLTSWLTWRSSNEYECV